MKVKFLQPLSQIVQHYDTVIGYYNNEYMGSPWRPESSELSLSSWGYPLDDREKALKEITEERDAFLFLSSINLGLVSQPYSGVDKPSIEVVHRGISRHEAFLKRIYKVDLTNFEKLDHKAANKAFLLLVKKTFRALKYYRFQVTLKGWYDKLPDRCMTWEEKYSSDEDDDM